MSAVPFKNETGAPPKTRIRVDWKRAAKLLAAGEAPEAVAATLGITQDRFWRHLTKSERFQFLIRQALERHRLAAQLQFESAGRQAVVQRCGRVAEIDGESWHWLARQTGLIAEEAGTEEAGKAAAAAPGREAGLVAALKATGRQPPTEAQLRRFRAERKAMDAQFAELKAWGRAAGILPPAPPTEPAAAKQAAPEHGRSNAAKPAIGGISENKTQISARETQISASETQAGATGAASGAPAIPDGATSKPASSQTHPYRAVVDLTDLHGNPLPGMEHLRR